MCHMMYHILCECNIKIWKPPVWPLNVCCVLGQGTLSTFVLVHKDKIGSRIRLKLIRDKLVSHIEGVYDFHPIKITETRNKIKTLIGRRKNEKKFNNANTSMKFVNIFTNNLMLWLCFNTAESGETVFI